MLCRASRDSSNSIEGLLEGGGASTVTWVAAWLLRPRESVQAAVTVIVPGAAPAVLRVAVFPLPERLPPVVAQLATEVGTPSGLVQDAVTVTVPPGVTLVGLAVSDRVGGFFGGSGFTV